jgi:hypothetical protein
MTVIVLDNDETTGFYSHLLTYMGYALRCRKLTAAQEVEMIPVMTRIAAANGVFRPGTADFLRALVERRRLGVVNSIVMYTNAYADPDMTWHTASWGTVDWPHFVARVLSCLAGVEDTTLFDVILSRLPSMRHIPYPKKSFERVVNALNNVRPMGDDERIIFFDDKPLEILGAGDRFIAWHVSEYKSPLLVPQIHAMMDEVFGADAEPLWPDYARAAITQQMLVMTAQCCDAAHPVHVVMDMVHWCGFDLDVHLPLPPPPAPEPASAIAPEHALPRPSTVRIPTVRIPTVRIHLELILKIKPHSKRNSRNKHKKRWSPSQHIISPRQSHPQSQPQSKSGR